MTDTHNRETIWKGRKFDFERVSFPGRDGRTLTREVVRHPGAVCILPVLDERPPDPVIVMIRIHRFALDREVWELPAGTLEKGEDPTACAARELIEETGYRARRIDPLGTFFTTPGMTDERMHAFLARGLDRVGQRLEEDEQIRAVPMPLSRALGLLDAGEFADAKSMLSLFIALRRGLIASPA